VGFVTGSLGVARFCRV